MLDNPYKGPQPSELRLPKGLLTLWSEYPSSDIKNYFYEVKKDNALWPVMAILVRRQCYMKVYTLIYLYCAESRKGTVRIVGQRLRKGIFKNEKMYKEICDLMKYFENLRVKADSQIHTKRTIAFESAYIGTFIAAGTLGVVSGTPTGMAFGSAVLAGGTFYRAPLLLLSVRKYREDLKTARRTT